MDKVSADKVYFNMLYVYILETLQTFMQLLLIFIVMR